MVKIKTSTAGNNRGFTLFELLVVLFIIGVAIAIVSVSMGRLREKTLFAEEARSVYLTVKHAREAAILERRGITLRIDEEKKTYWLDYEDAKVSDNHVLPGRYELTGPDIFFFPKGNSTGGHIEIQNEKGQKYAIEVNPVLGTPSIKRL